MIEYHLVTDCSHGTTSMLNFSISLQLGLTEKIKMSQNRRENPKKFEGCWDLNQAHKLNLLYNSCTVQSIFIWKICDFVYCLICNLFGFCDFKMLLISFCVNLLF